MADTVIVVGTTELDEYGHLWVTPKGGGERVKIAKKRVGLHPLFEQGVAVLLKWETYQNHPYVADAKLVAGELQPAQEPTILPKDEKIIEEARKEAVKKEPAPQELGMWWKEVGEMIRAEIIKREGPTAVYWKAYWLQMSNVLNIRPEEK